MQRYLKVIGNGQRTARDLSTEEAEAAISLIMDGQASMPQVAVFMAALRIKEESAAELATFVRVIRRYCQRLPLDLPYLVDICVPYDGSSRLPSVLPLAALIAASAGAKVVLHGRLGQNTAPKFGVGIGDILADLQVPVAGSIQRAATLLTDEAMGVAYLDSTQFAPALERFNGVRLDYGMRSFFNTVEKLINPFDAPNGIVGVFHGPVLTRVAQAMQAQGYQRCVAVQGSEGAIDVLTSRRTPIITFGLDGETVLREATIDPTAFGWWERSEESEPTAPITSAMNADLMRHLIDPANQSSALTIFRHSALLTAALIVYTAGKEPTFEQALANVQHVLAGQSVLDRLARWQAHSGESISSIAQKEIANVR